MSGFKAYHIAVATGAALLLLAPHRNAQSPTMAAGWHAAADGSDWAAIDGNAVEWGQAADSDTELSGPDPPQPADPGPPHIVREEPGSPGDNGLTDGDELHPKRMGKFIMALCQDLDGNLWVGTEDTGVWRFSPNAENGRRWAQFARERTNGKPEPAGPTLPAQSADADCLGDNVAYAHRRQPADSVLFPLGMVRCA